MVISFEQIDKHNLDNQNILCNGAPVGTVYIQSNHPKPGDMVWIVRDLKDRVAIVPTDGHAISKMIMWAIQDGEGILFDDYTKHLQSQVPAETAKGRLYGIWAKLRLLFQRITNRGR